MTLLCKQIYEKITVQFAIVVYLIVFKLRRISQNVYKYQFPSDLTLGLEHINYLHTKAEDENHFWKSLERLIKVGYDQALPGNRKWNAKCQAKCLREDNPESRREYWRFAFQKITPVLFFVWRSPIFLFYLDHNRVYLHGLLRLWQSEFPIHY